MLLVKPFICVYRLALFLVTSFLSTPTGSQFRINSFCGEESSSQNNNSPFKIQKNKAACFPWKIKIIFMTKVIIQLIMAISPMIRSNQRYEEGEKTLKVLLEH